MKRGRLRELITPSKRWSQLKRKVYIETSVASYLTAGPSRDLAVAGHQELTAQWRADHPESEPDLSEPKASDPETSEPETSGQDG